MKLNSSLEASFIKTDDFNKSRNLSLEIGKIYKANILYSKGNFLYFSINNFIFKTNFIQTSSKYLLLKVIENKEVYKFELIKENIFFENSASEFINLFNLLRKKYSDNFVDNILKNSFIDLTKNSSDDFQSIIINSNYIYEESKYHLMIKIKDNNYLHIELSEFEPLSYSFTLNFEIDGRKLVLVKGYYNKKENKVNCNFITNSSDFFKQSLKAQSELSDINNKYIWLCKQRFEENISL